MLKCAMTFLRTSDLGGRVIGGARAWWGTSRLVELHAAVLQLYIYGQYIEILDC